MIIYSRLYLGVVLSNTVKESSKAQDYVNKIDFVIGINKGSSCEIRYLLEGFKF